MQSVYPIDISHIRIIIIVETNNISYEGSVMACVRTKVFRSNRSQAIRLPKEVAFPESVKDVEVTAIGNRRMIEPLGQSWEEWFNAPGVSSDFMMERKQPKDQLRESIEC